MTEPVQISEEEYSAFQAWRLTKYEGDLSEYHGYKSILEDLQGWQDAHNEEKFPISRVPGWFTEEDVYDHNGDGDPDEMEEIEWEVLDGSAEHNWEEIAEIAFTQAERGYAAINWLHLLRELKKNDTSCSKHGGLYEMEEGKRVWKVGFEHMEERMVAKEKERQERLEKRSKNA